MNVFHPIQIITLIPILIINRIEKNYTIDFMIFMYAIFLYCISVNFFPLVIRYFSLIENSSSFDRSREVEGKHNGNMHVCIPWKDFSLVAKKIPLIKSRHKSTHFIFRVTVWDPKLNGVWIICTAKLLMFVITFK